MTLTTQITVERDGIEQDVTVSGWLTHERRMDGGGGMATYLDDVQSDDVTLTPDERDEAEMALWAAWERLEENLEAQREDADEARREGR